MSKEQHLFETKCFCSKATVFFVTFGQFYVFFLKEKTITLLNCSVSGFLVTVTLSLFLLYLMVSLALTLAHISVHLEHRHLWLWTSPHETEPLLRSSFMLANWKHRAFTLGKHSDNTGIVLPPKKILGFPLSCIWISESRITDWRLPAQSSVKRVKSQKEKRKEQPGS